MDRQPFPSRVARPESKPAGPVIYTGIEQLIVLLPNRNPTFDLHLTNRFLYLAGENLRLSGGVIGNLLLRSLGVAYQLLSFTGQSLARVLAWERVAKLSAWLCQLEERLSS
jgi:hypothetical protein